MNIRAVTPFELLEWDPDGLCRRKVGEQRAAKPCYEAPSKWLNISPDQALLRHDKMIASLPVCHKPYIEYDLSLRSKYGPQGGSVSWETRMTALSRYYAAPTFDGPLPPALVMGRDYLIRVIREKIAEVGYPQIDDSLGRCGTYASIPSGRKKGSYIAETMGLNPNRHVYPCMLGTRRMRGKDRLIFMDALPNVRGLENVLAAVRNWLKKYLPQWFGSWTNPACEVNPRITRAVDRNSYFLETDYKDMDTHFTKRHASEVIFPILEVLLEPYGCLREFARIEEFFDSKVFLGYEVVEGLHALFSGEVITNDFETLYSICLFLGSLIIEHFNVADQEVLALGDDALVALEKHLGYGDAERLMQRVIETSSLTGMIIHDMQSGKSAIARGNARYLRRVYYTKGKRNLDGVLYGNYPSVLVLNNIIQPEHPSYHGGQAFLADMQRLDNMYSAPDWSQMVDFVAKFARYSASYSALDVDRINEKDWWSYLYAERWIPDSSPSVQAFKERRR